MYNIILGSGSPRRHEILDLAGIKHTVIVPKADESEIHYVGDCQRYVKQLAKLKSDALTELLGTDEYKTKIDFSNTVTICADTVVFSPKKPYPLGKPKSFDEACDMLRAFSGTYHYVLTGVCIRKNPTSDVSEADKSEEIIFIEETKVHFRTLSDSEIERYINEEKPFDKAGAYGIQERACAFVSGIEGDFYNVMGLPVCRIVEKLKEIDVL